MQGHSKSANQITQLLIRQDITDEDKNKQFIIIGNKIDELTELPSHFTEFLDLETIFISAKRNESHVFNRSTFICSDIANKCNANKATCTSCGFNCPTLDELMPWNYGVMIDADATATDDGYDDDDDYSTTVDCDDEKYDDICNDTCN